MSLAGALMAVIWTGVTLYAVLGGADFGGGILHLLASGDAAEREREAITDAMGPVWEANHVWLIFVLTGLLSAFPRAFGALGTAVFLPGTLALVAIVVRGAALALCSPIAGRPGARVSAQRLFGAASVAAPFLLGVIAGELARRGAARTGQPVHWLGPLQLVVGALAAVLCVAVAAVFLTVEAARAGKAELAAGFRRRGLQATAAAGVLALAGLA
ncbi:MAG: cytochrome d ubiquinol oxidase subunit II, partial [Actinomycetota bacterium]|nr:cytochrome d ubiquinol oxidase subunit II [Actinomycetota bacterium]